VGGFRKLDHQKSHTKQDGKRFSPQRDKKNADDPPLPVLSGKNIRQVAIMAVGKGDGPAHLAVALDKKFFAVPDEATIRDLNATGLQHVLTVLSLPYRGKKAPENRAYLLEFAKVHQDITNRRNNRSAQEKEIQERNAIPNEASTPSFCEYMRAIIVEQNKNPGGFLELKVLSFCHHPHICPFPSLHPLTLFPLSLVIQTSVLSSFCLLSLINICGMLQMPVPQRCLDKCDTFTLESDETVPVRLQVVLATDYKVLQFAV
jgi:hypothetical protein